MVFEINKLIRYFKEKNELRKKTKTCCKICLKINIGRTKIKLKLYSLAQQSLLKLLSVLFRRAKN